MLTDILLKEVHSATTRIDYRVPIKFGGRVVVDVTLFDVRVTVETRDGRRATGTGSMPMGNAWAWPSSQGPTAQGPTPQGPTAQVTGEQSLSAMVEMATRLASESNDCPHGGHPLEITHAIAPRYAAIADDVVRELQLPEPMPRLAQLVAASPLEAAIHDAYGKALGANSYDLLGPEYVNADLARYLTPEFAGEYLDQYTLRTPKARIPLYHLVGALDPLTDGDLPQRVNDGLPETLGEWILADGLTHLKIKLAGDDLGWDVERVVRVDQVSEVAQAQRGCTRWQYSLDFNEKCADVQYVLDFLARVRERAPAALDRVQYIEQPTHRDLRARPDNRMHAAARIKPVVIDESLIDLDSLQCARELGYSGVALKACKGQTEALLMGAAAQKYGLFLCVQDLTCVGASFLHSASLAARIPTVAAIEGNGRQYCPAGNAGWRDRYPGMFSIHDGTVETGLLVGNGLY
jgi:L-alanine-DL-glutamate epimerase-like enolase superfamily enzyme